MLCRLQEATLRLWWRTYSDGVLLIPLVSWVAPANVSEGGLLVPSLQYCARRWSWWPAVVVADMGYLAAEAKRRCREKWRVAVVTKLRANMKLVPPFTAWNQTACLQGQRLEWLGYAPSEDLHWYGVTDSQPLCSCCWQAADCPRQFAHAPAEHETLLGLLPLSSHPAQRLLRQVRPWIEPAQSFEKNQLGLSQMCFNSLRLVLGFAGRCRSLAARPGAPMRSSSPRTLERAVASSNRDGFHRVGTAPCVAHPKTSH